MKPALAIIAILSALFQSYGTAAETNSLQAAVDLGVIQSDVSIALKQYEKVRILQHDANLERQLLSADSAAPTDKLAAIDKRIAALEQELLRLRAIADIAVKTLKDKVVREAMNVSKLRATAKISDPNPDSADAVISTDRLQPNLADKAAAVAAKADVSAYIEAKTRYLQAKLELQSVERIVTTDTKRQ